MADDKPQIESKRTNETQTRTILSTEERRQKVWQLWNLGNHNIKKISETVGSCSITVKRDIIVLKRRWELEEKTGKQTARLKATIALGYLADIEQIDEVIAKALVAGDTDYTAIASLFDKKFKGRRQLSELYNLVASGPGVEVNVPVSVDASSSATAVNAQYNLQGISDADVIAATKGIFNRVSETLSA